MPRLPSTSWSGFFTDPEFLSNVVQFDLPRLGDVTGVRGIHLQCHIGTDTVSLSRLGARMTGVDFSPASLEQARRIAAGAGADVEFVECDLYSVPDHLPQGVFDLVYTGTGALCWLPDVRRWAQVVAPPANNPPADGVSTTCEHWTGPHAAPGGGHHG